MGASARARPPLRSRAQGAAERAHRTLRGGGRSVVAGRERWRVGRARRCRCCLLRWRRRRRRRGWRRRVPPREAQSNCTATTTTSSPRATETRRRISGSPTSCAMLQNCGAVSSSRCCPASVPSRAAQCAPPNTIATGTACRSPGAAPSLATRTTAAGRASVTWRCALARARARMHSRTRARVLRLRSGLTRPSPRRCLPSPFPPAA